uniref:Uncharacterized protein n=1 Tax=Rhodosorus marinus TaxID=101924 RepID=A0A7S0G7X3_9RHOD|mmetsp:Transcript_4950/g.6905  ORF Transcript_4950/g.6905 Transcript_4950/m.6905 type:complete len:303 (+) Transcript_4950:259-1167(+)
MEGGLASGLAAIDLGKGGRTRMVHLQGVTETGTEDGWHVSQFLELMMASKSDETRWNSDKVSLTSRSSSEFSNCSAYAGLKRFNEALQSRESTMSSTTSYGSTTDKEFTERVREWSQAENESLEQKVKVLQGKDKSMKKWLKTKPSLIEVLKNPKAEGNMPSTAEMERAYAAANLASEAVHVEDETQACSRGFCLSIVDREYSSGLTNRSKSFPTVETRQAKVSHLQSRTSELRACVNKVKSEKRPQFATAAEIIPDSMVIEMSQSESIVYKLDAKAPPRTNSEIRLDLETDEADAEDEIYL